MSMRAINLALEMVSDELPNIPTACADTARCWHQLEMALNALEDTRTTYQFASNEAIRQLMSAIEQESHAFYGDARYPLGIARASEDSIIAACIEAVHSAREATNKTWHRLPSWASEQMRAERPQPTEPNIDPKRLFIEQLDPQLLGRFFAS